MKVTPFELPRKGSVLSVLVLSDIHSEYINLDAFYTAKRFFEQTPKKRRRIILLGDILDFEAFVFKSESFKVAKKNKDFDGYFVPEMNKEVEWFEWFLSEIRSLVYDYKHIWYVSGNHESRLQRKEFTSFVPHAYLPNFHLQEALRIHYRNINFIEYNDWLKISTNSGDLMLTHGVYCGANPIKKHADVARGSVMFGHTHERGVRSFKNVEGTFIGYNNPCLCDTRPKYMEGKPTNWSVGFSTIQITTDNFWVNQFTINDGILLDSHGRKI